MTYSCVKNMFVVHTSTVRLRPKVVLLSVADPDPGLSAFLTSGSKMGKIRIRDEHPR